MNNFLRTWPQTVKRFAQWGKRAFRSSTRDRSNKARARSRAVAGSVEAMESRQLLAAPTGLEQEMLELINRMRLDPRGEFGRLISSVNPISSPIPGVNPNLQFYGTNGAVLQQQFNALVAVPPLAWSSSLNDAAALHNQRMIQADQQSHQLPGEPGLGARATAAGYTNFSSLGESIFAYADSVLFGHAGFAIDWGPGPNGIQSPPGHRDNYVSPNFREIGISITPESNPATQVGPLVITQDFGARFNQGNPFLLGVVYNDQNGDNFYQNGEGLGNVNVAIAGPGGNFNTTTTASGGYQIQLPNGSYNITFSGGGLPAPVARTATVSGGNVKVDATPSLAGQLQFSVANYSVNENAGTVTVTVARSGGAAGEVTVNYATANGSAIAGQDYTAANGSLTFANGVTERTFTVPISNDAVDEANETFTIVLSNPTGGASLGAVSTATATIVDDDDPAGSLQFELAGYSFVENVGFANLVVTRTGGTAGTVAVNVQTANVSAVAGQDYDAVSTTLTFAPGQTQRTLSIAILDDDLVEDSESFSVTLSNPTGGATLGQRSSAAVTIDSDDIPPGVLEFNAAIFEVNEAAGTAVIQVNRLVDAAGAVSVNYDVTEGTAFAGADFQATSGVLHFGDGQTVATFTVSIINDNLIEGPETINLTLSNPAAGAILGNRSSATLRIVSDDAASTTIQFAQTEFVVEEGSGGAVISVTRAGDLSAAGMVSYSAVAETAVAGSDFTPVSGTLTFLAGEATRSFMVPILNDQTIDGLKTISLTLTNPTAGAVLGSADSATIRINDDDSVIRLIADFIASLSEGAGFVRITATRTGDLRGSASVDYSTAAALNSSNSASPGVDFTAVSGTLTFGDGESAKTFDVPLLEDAIDEDDEVFRIVLSNPSGNATLGDPAAGTVRITDNDAPADPSILQIIGLEPVIAANVLTGFRLFFETDLDPATVADFANYSIVEETRPGQASALSLASAVFSRTDRSATLTFSRPALLGSFVRFNIDGLRAANGQRIDGDNDGAAGGLYSASLGLGRSLSYADSRRNRVTLSLTGPGLLLIRRDAFGDPKQIRLIDAVRNQTTLNGKFRRVGSTTTVLPRIENPNRAKIKLRNPPFRIV